MYWREMYKWNKSKNTLFYLMPTTFYMYSIHMWYSMHIHVAQTYMNMHMYKYMYMLILQALYPLYLVEALWMKFGTWAPYNHTKENYISCYLPSGHSSSQGFPWLHQCYSQTPLRAWCSTCRLSTSSGCKARHCQTSTVCHHRTGGNKNLHSNLY